MFCVSGRVFGRAAISDIVLGNGFLCCFMRLGLVALLRL
jgi:hypothetical protein